VLLLHLRILPAGEAGGSNPVNPARHSPAHSPHRSPPVVLVPLSGAGCVGATRLLGAGARLHTGVSSIWYRARWLD
jgi:hypothetical protein